MALPESRAHLNRRLFGSKLRITAALPQPDGYGTGREGNPAHGGDLGGTGVSCGASRRWETAQTSHRERSKRPAMPPKEFLVFQA